MEEVLLAEYLDPITRPKQDGLLAFHDLVKKKRARRSQPSRCRKTKRRKPPRLQRLIKKSSRRLNKKRPRRRPRND